MRGWPKTSRAAGRVGAARAASNGRRLEKAGLIASEWGTTERNRQARYYRLTAAGRRALGDELESWRRFAAGLEAVLRTT